jgi:hypothetical protein
MVPPRPSVRALLLGPDAFQRRLDGLLALAIGALTGLAYATELFELGGGVVFVPFHAAVVGLVGAAGIGFRRGGLALGWLVAYTPYLGLQVTWAFLWLSSTRTLGDRLAFVVDPAGLAFFALFAAVVGGVGYALGYLLALGSERLQAAPNGNA